jgi:CRP-like cAMP-binding protein
MQVVEYKAGEVIISEGEEGKTAFFIQSGAVEVIVGTDAKAKVVGLLGVGEVFGEMSLLEPAPRSASVRATADTRCVVTSHDEFIVSMQENPEQAVEFMKTLVRRLRRMNELMARMDPQKRRWHEMLLDWQSTIESSDSGISEEEKKNYYSAMYQAMI